MCTPVMQMVIVSDPHLVDSIVGRTGELEKSTSVFYDQFNVVCLHLLALWELKESALRLSRGMCIGQHDVR